MHDIYSLQGDPLRRVVRLLSDDDVGNLRAVSRGLRGIVPHVDQTERYERKIDELFAHSTWSSRDVRSWEEASGRTLGGLSESSALTRPASTTPDGAEVSSGAHQAATRPPTWTIIDPARVPQLRLGDALFTRARSEVASGSPARANEALHLLSLLPWRSVYVEALARDLRRLPGDRAQIYLENFFESHCVLGSEAGLSIFEVSSWRELAPSALDHFLTHGKKLLRELPEDFPSSSRLVQLGISFLSYPADYDGANFSSAIRRIELVRELIDAGHLDQASVTSALRSACVADFHEVVERILAGENPRNRTNGLNFFRTELNYLRRRHPPFA